MSEADRPVLGREAQAPLVEEEAVEVTFADRGEAGHGAAAERRRPVGNQARGRYDDNNATLSVDEIRGGRRAGANVTTEAERKPGDTNRDDSLLSPFDLLKGKSANAEPSDVEPARDVLTDPPTGYRQSPKKLAQPPSRDPINNASREREEADPRAYQRQRAQQ